MSAAPNQVERIHALWQHHENRSILTMPRADWARLKVQAGTHVPVDLQRTPMSQLASSVSVLATAATRFSAQTAEIQIFRWDEQDQPTPVNKDTYVVWDNVDSHETLKRCIASSGVSVTAELHNFLTNNVFLIKSAPGPDHWRRSLPSYLSLMVSSQSSKG